MILYYQTADSVELNLSLVHWKMERWPLCFKSFTCCANATSLVSGVNRKHNDETSIRPPKMAGGNPAIPEDVPKYTM